MAAPRTKDEWVAHLQLLKADLERDEQFAPSDPDEGLVARSERLLEHYRARIELGHWLLEEEHTASTRRMETWKSLRERLKGENPDLEDFRVDLMVAEELNKSNPNPSEYLRSEARDLFAQTLDRAEELELDIDHPRVLITLLRCYDGLAECVDDHDYANELRMAAIELRKRLLSYAKDVEMSQREIAEELTSLAWATGVDGFHKAFGNDKWDQTRRWLLEAHGIYRQLVVDYPETPENVGGLLETLIAVVHDFPPAKGGAENTQLHAFAEEARSALNHLREIGIVLPQQEDRLAVLNEAIASLE